MSFFICRARRCVSQKGSGVIGSVFCRGPTSAFRAYHFEECWTKAKCEYICNLGANNAIGRVVARWCILTTRAYQLNLNSIRPEGVTRIITSKGVLLSKGIVKVKGSDDLSLIEEAGSGSAVCSNVGSWDDLLRNVKGAESKTMLNGLLEAEMVMFAATPWADVVMSLLLVAYKADVLDKIQLKVAREEAGDWSKVGPGKQRHVSGSEVQVCRLGCVWFSWVCSSLAIVSSSISCQAYTQTNSKANDNQRSQHQKANPFASSSLAHHRSDGDELVPFYAVRVQDIGRWHSIMTSSWNGSGEVGAVAPSASQPR
ncbi:hypothetical protein KCU59_g90, partial [Aureobasidium melanogenum]